MDESNHIEDLFARALDKFLMEISGLSNSLPVITQSLHDDVVGSAKEIDTFLNEKGHLLEEDTGDGNENLKKYGIELEHFYDFNRLVNVLSKTKASAAIIPKSFLVAMVSQFDAFIGQLIRTMYYAEPTKLNASKKPLTFSNLVQFDSIEDAREHILEREVESVLRESHSAHFEWLEGKLGIPLRKGLDCWPTFVEITERRNLFVHTDGEISQSYIENCKKYGMQISDEYAVGDRLSVDPDYYQDAYEALYEIATKLAHVMWRKLVPSELDAADRHLINISYELLKDEQYSLAKKILSFALDLPKHHSQRSKLVYTINLSIAYKWGGEPENAKRLVTGTDWSASSMDFQLASAVLLEKYDKAATIMKQIGDSGQVRKVDYKDWPVFQDFRHSPQFLETFNIIFGEALETIEIDESATLENENTYEKSILLNDLDNSRSFMQTHSVIEKLSNFSDFSVAQRNHIVATTISNDQIYRIINDQDVNAFLHMIIDGYENKINNENLARLQEIF